MGAGAAGVVRKRGEGFLVLDPTTDRAVRFHASTFAFCTGCVYGFVRAVLLTIVASAPSMHVLVRRNGSRFSLGFGRALAVAAAAHNHNLKRKCVLRETND